MEIEPEYESVETFAEFLFDDERSEFTGADLVKLAFQMKLSTGKVRAELESYGLTLAHRPHEKHVRGYTSWDNNRYAGNPMAGGSGWEQISGFAGQKG